MRTSAGTAAAALLLAAGCSAGTPSTTAAPGPMPTTAAPTAVVPTAVPRPRATPTNAGPTAAVPKGSLTGKVVVLDPGHNRLNSVETARADALVPAGGFEKPCNTSGTATDGGYPEHAYNWDVAVRAAALLRSQGARVILTRPDDDGFGPCVDQRAAIANEAHADATIAIHADGAAASGYGFHVIEPGIAPDGGNAGIISRSATLALDLRAAFHAVTGEAFSSYTGIGGLTKRTDLAGLNLARVPAVFIECGNMRNASDAGKLTSAAFRQRSAVGIDQALLAFLG